MNNLKATLSLQSDGSCVHITLQAANWLQTSAVTQRVNKANVDTSQRTDDGQKAITKARTLCSEGVGSDLHEIEGVGSDLHEMESVGSELHEIEGVGSDLHGIEGVGSDLHEIEGVGSDLHEDLEVVVSDLMIGQNDSFSKADSDLDDEDIPVIHLSKNTIKRKWTLLHNKQANSM
ncbi:hypothetical protein DPMN_112017 [Dreissena polymorpha]|uniref:Uncharacterized protein n=1 Tax=Dreissena polymorpha TaxID=45954 RepID=A0A9D4KFK2_DREPO|nr:hypothetical protein DPMN_112017 [Dreissena polymorpha]